jgi:hypothetical protein
MAFFPASFVYSSTEGLKSASHVELFRTNDGPVIDAIIDDIWDMVEAVALETDFENENPSVGAYWKALYDENHIFLLLEVDDDEHLPAWMLGAGDHWMYDKPEIYFDVNNILADGGGGNNSGDGHWQFAPPFIEEFYGVPYSESAGLREPVLYCYNPTGNGYIVEYAFPFNAMPQSDGSVLDMEGFKGLPEGIGFDITVIDRDTGDETRNRKVWQNDGSICGESWACMDPCGTISLSDQYVGVELVARAGADQTVSTGEQVTLDGSASLSLSGNPITYHWTAPEGIQLNSVEVVNPMFVAPSVFTQTTYTFTLTISDGVEQSAPSEVRITVVPETVIGNFDLLIASTDVSPIIDGGIDPLWNDLEAHHLNNWLAGSPVSPGVFSAWFKTTWDESNLYILVSVSDEVLINDSPNIWEDDAVEIYLDINNDKQTSYGDDDYQFSFRWNDPVIHTGSQVSGVEFVISDTPEGYTLEVIFPWASLGEYDPMPGNLLGIDVHVHDDDNGGGRDRKLAWFTEVDQSWQDPSLFATARLTGEIVVEYPAEEPSVSVNHGFFDQPFNVTVSSSVPGMQIIYTLDGTNPANSATAFARQAPVVVRIDPALNEGRGLTPAVTLMAVARKEGYDFSPAITRTYIFPDMLSLQTQHPGHDWPDRDINDQVIDLTISERIYNDSRYNNQMKDALLQIPSVSIVTDGKNLFDSQTGIYVNALRDGREWERPASIELINPDGTKGFQIDAGIRIRGGYSRNPWFRKHAFRFFFRSQYSVGTLRYPMFEDEGVKRFDKLDLRCSQNYSWHRNDGESPYATYNRDVFSRDIQGLMGQPYTRSRYYHLYLNGLYWGLFQSQERSESRYGESYFGDDPSGFDVIKRDGGGIVASDGTLDLWREVWNVTRQGYSDISNYFKLMGLDGSGKRDPSMKILVDIDNLIDYMNIIFYTGNFDAPVSKFMGNDGPNNFYAMYNRSKNDGFIFFAHDNEHTLLMDPTGPGDGLTENRVNIGNISGNMRMEVGNFDQFHPQWLHHRLTESEDYRIRFADRAAKYYFDNGLLTPENAAEVFYSRTLEYDTAIIAESARWGGSVSWSNYTKDDSWIPIIQRTMNEYFPYRTDIVIEQLQNEGLLPNISPPEFFFDNEKITTESVELEAGERISLSNPNSSGTLFFTVDGSDPRQSGGELSASAVSGENLSGIDFVQSTILKARIYDGSEWSAIKTLNVNINDFVYGIQITEIHYDPPGGDGFAGSQYEFIELKNVSDRAVNLTNASFVEGIYFTFKTETILEPGEFILLASQPFLFTRRYGFEPAGQYSGLLNNGGERVTLVSATGQIIVSVEYNNNQPWPTSANGLGFSLVPVSSDLTLDWNDGNNWRASSIIDGTPGADDHGVEIDPVWVNEVLASTDMPDVDAIEIYNPNNHAVDISHWYLSDNRSNPKKWQIPDGTVINGNEYIVFYEGYFEGAEKRYNREHFGSEFAMSTHGEEVFVFSALASGELTGYEHGFEFGESRKGISFGRHVISTGEDHFVAMAELTMGNENSHPFVGPVIINQIMYHSLDGHFDYVELVNISDNQIALFDSINGIGWRLAGVDFNFPLNTYIGPGESVYLVESGINPNDFRFMYAMDENMQIFNYRGTLQNSGERLELRMPAPEYVNDESEMVYPYIVIDRVSYDDDAPWPDADGNGMVLKRIDIHRYANDPDNWEAVPAGIRINNHILAVGVEGVSYSHKLSASGGMAPWSWSIQTGSLPDGLNLDASTGEISGFPLEYGTFSFKISVSDQYDESAEVQLSITVEENTLPHADDDYVSTKMNMNVTAYVINNDTDEDGEKPQWLIDVISEPASGTYIINNDKSITYFPDTGFLGSDQLSYQITDYSGTVQAVMFIEVEPQISTASLDVRVSQATDDAEENIHTSQFWANSSDLELTYDPSPGGEQVVGIRFSGMQIPNSAAITDAYIQFVCDETTEEATQLFIHAEAHDNPSLFSENNLISTRNTTTASVEWNPQPWLVVGEASEKQRTADLSGVVQELVNREGWRPGNAMAFIVSGTGSRVAIAYDGDPNAAPLLHIEYQTHDEEPVVPVAIAEISENPTINSLLSLSGAESYSIDGRALNYFWNLESKPEGSSAELSNKYIADPAFTPDVYGTYEFSLLVNNGVFDSDKVFVVVEIGNLPPLADAGYDLYKVEGDEVRLNGNNSYDPEGNELTFLWTIEETPEGSGAYLSNPEVSNPIIFTDIPGTYRISLLVSDGENESEVDEVLIFVSENIPPLAIISTDNDAFTGSIVSLSGEESYDPEGRDITFTWVLLSKPAGSNAVMVNAAYENSSFFADVQGNYTVQLVVNDGRVDSEPVEVVITVLQYSPPVADAGSDQRVDKGSVVQLDGSGSYTPDGYPLSYFWTFVTRPANSNATLNDYSVVNPSFTPDKSGLYTLRLRVSDGVSTATDDVQVLVDPSSNIVLFNNDYSLRVYPNPFSDRLFVESEDEVSGKVLYELYSLSGSLIEVVERQLYNERTQRIDFDTSTLKSGVYFLMVKSEQHPPYVMRLIYRDSGNR